MISNKARRYSGVLHLKKLKATAAAAAAASSVPCRSIVTVTATLGAAETDLHHLPKIFRARTLGTGVSPAATNVVAATSQYSTSSPTQQQRQQPHRLNINHALKKSDEGHYFHDIVGSSVSTLQGIGPKHLEQLEILGLKTIEQLGNYKYFQMARAIKTLATAEESGQRSESSTMNINNGLDKSYEHLSLKEMLELPVHAIQGITESKITESKSNEIWTAGLGVRTIGDLAEFKYCKWAEAMVVASKFEETK